jgi:transposase
LGSIIEIARKYEIHPNQIGQWKKEFLSNAAAVFASGEKKSEDKKQQETLLEKLYSQIGQQKVEIDWLKKKCCKDALGQTCDDRKGNQYKPLSSVRIVADSS